MCSAFSELTIEVSKAHADGNHQCQDDAPVQATAELALVLLLPGRLRLGLRRRPRLGLGARHPALPRAPFAHRGAGLAAGFITAGLIGAGLR